METSRLQRAPEGAEVAHPVEGKLARCGVDLVEGGTSGSELVQIEHAYSMFDMNVTAFCSAPCRPRTQ